MVLWEITLGTAYFLGLKRTYRLALKIQRKLITPEHPKIRDFVHRRTRNVFDAALTVHRKVQERDIEVGRNLGNRILRFLDRVKPEAQIRRPSPPAPKPNTNTTKQLNNSKPLNNQGLPKSTDKESDRHLFAASRSFLPNTPTIAMMIKPTRPIGHNVQYRQYATGGSEFFTVNRTRFGPGEVLRNDIRYWSLHQ
ncbi:envelope glycoprotein [Perilla frutescens var. frutescens]|nr:envelope glycoprotein [Perilla frutescens var. frutescens]